jgi:predicted DNA-binding transcriptional regulator YafY
MRGDQLARQWQLIQRLGRSRAGLGLDELAEELGCVRRTVYRDLDALMYAGFPVVSERRDNNKVYYRFLDSFKLGDIPFTTDEILALAFGEDLLRTLEGTVFHDSIRSALAKIRAGLGDELASFLDHLADSFRVLPGPHKRYADSREAIEALNQAVLARHTVRMRYRTGRTGEESSRDLDPYHVWYQRGSLYVIGHDHRSDDIRTFAVDRILSLETTERRFEIDPDFDFEAKMASGFGVVAEPATCVRIRFAKPWVQYVREHSWHDSQKLSDEDDGRLLLELQVGTTHELRSWILSFGAGAEVLEPESLRKEVRDALAEALAVYSD